jgi:acetyl-CoA acetyltransferase
MTAAIVGIGQTEFSKDSGRSELQLAVEAVHAAIVDAGLSPADIDGMVTFYEDTNNEIAIARSIGIPELRWTARTPWGGSNSAATVEVATAAVESGMAKAVVIYRAFNERSGRRFGQPPEGRPAIPSSMSPYMPFGLDTPAKMYSLWYQGYMNRYGVTNEDLGRYTVVARQHAATNPAAWFYQRPITLEDHQASRWIVEPILRKLDCCQESDGGVALMVTTMDRAKDLPQAPVRVAGTLRLNEAAKYTVVRIWWEPHLVGTRPEAVSGRLWMGHGPSTRWAFEVCRGWNRLEGHDILPLREAADTHRRHASLPLARVSTLMRGYGTSDRLGRPSGSDLPEEVELLHAATLGAKPDAPAFLGRDPSRPLVCAHSGRYGRGRHHFRAHPDVHSRFARDRHGILDHRPA